MEDLDPLKTFHNRFLAEAMEKDDENCEEKVFCGGAVFSAEEKGGEGRRSRGSSVSEGEGEVSDWLRGSVTGSEDR